MWTSQLISFAALVSCAIAGDAYLWTIDHGNVKYANTQASSISSNTASSILARRRGLSDEEFQMSSDARMLRDVNVYGGYQVPMSDAESETVPSKLFIRISGYTGSVSQFPTLPDLWIEKPAKDLAEGFKARKNVDGVCEYSFDIPTKENVELIYTYYTEDSTCLPKREVQMKPAVITAFSTVPTAENIAKNINSLLRTLSHLSVTGNVESTILILPPVSKLVKSKTSKRSLPSEEPLEIPSTNPEMPSETFASVKADNTSHPLPRVIPQCFSSQDSCEDHTNSCSGHGDCYKAHNNCYKCRCGTTVVRENSDGTKKTVQWGGNACQKKDVSVEFALFATFGVVMAALIAGAIGAMYNMGSQDLPSVLGAGVAGPRAQK